MSSVRTLLASLLLAFVALPAMAADAPAADAPKADAPAANPNAYPLDYCATCGPEEKGEHLITKMHKDREIKLCKGCVKIFNADPDGYVKKVDKVIKEAAKAKGDKPEEKKDEAKKDGHEGHDHGDHKH